MEIGGPPAGARKSGAAKHMRGRAWLARVLPLHPLHAGV